MENEPNEKEHNIIVEEKQAQYDLCGHSNIKPEYLCNPTIRKLWRMGSTHVYVG